MTTNTFDITGPIDLQARLTHGRITVTAIDDLTAATVEVTGNSDAVDKITVEMRGTTLAINAPRQGGIFDLLPTRWRDRDAVDIDVRVPSDTPAKIGTFSANVETHGRLGATEVGTGSASINLDHVAGDLLLRYGSASCDVKKVDGSAVVRAGSGNAKLGSIGGSLQAGCGSGRLEVGSIRGSVHSRTGSGEAILGLVHGNVDLASGSGGVQIGLPVGVAARLDVTTGSGSVNTDLPIELGQRGDGPAITIRARTGSGNIRIFRAAEQAA